MSHAPDQFGLHSMRMSDKKNLVGNAVQLKRISKAIFRMPLAMGSGYEEEPNNKDQFFVGFNWNFSIHMECTCC